MFVEDFIEVTLSGAEKRKLLLAVKYIKSVNQKFGDEKGTTIIVEGMETMRIECDDDYESVREQIALVKLLPHVVKGEKNGTEKG